MISDAENRTINDLKSKILSIFPSKTTFWTLLSVNAISGAREILLSIVHWLDIDRYDVMRTRLEKGQEMSVRFSRACRGFAGKWSWRGQIVGPTPRRRTTNLEGLIVIHGLCARCPSLHARLHIDHKLGSRLCGQSSLSQCNKRKSNPGQTDRRLGVRVAALD